MPTPGPVCISTIPVSLLIQFRKLTQKTFTSNKVPIRDALKISDIQGVLKKLDILGGLDTLSEDIQGARHIHHKYQRKTKYNRNTLLKRIHRLDHDFFVSTKQEEDHDGKNTHPKHPVVVERLCK